MTERLVFIPVTANTLTTLAADKPLVGPRAFTVTAELLGDGPDAAEEAEYLAMLLASVAALSEYGERLVVVATASPEAITDPDNGEAKLGQLEFSQVEAFFSEDPTVDASVAAAACSGLGLDEAWVQEEVQALLREADLLWHDATELAKWAAEHGH